MNVIDAGINFLYKWPANEEIFQHYIVYRIAYEGNDDIEATIVFGERKVYEKLRKRVMVLINGKIQAEFVGVDDFEYNGNLISEIKTGIDGSIKMVRYPSDTIGSQYSLFSVNGIANFIDAKGVHGGWGILVNIADHRQIIALGILRKEERNK